MTYVPKIALVGCGHISHIHYKFLKQIGLTVDSVCDSSETRATAFANQYGIEKVCTNLESLFYDFKPDVVHVLVPPQLHYSVAMQALQNNAHVFVEKPLCETRAELNCLFELAKEKGLNISVDHTRVYNPLIVQARKRIKDGEFGSILKIAYEYDDPSVEKINSRACSLRYKKGTPAWFKSLRGGVIADLLPHPLSVLLSFDDQLKIADVGGRARRNIIEEVSVRLVSDTLTANISMSVHIKPLRNRLFIFCENGSIFIDIRNLYAIYLPDRGLPNIISRIVDTFSGSFQTQFRFMKSVFQLMTGKIHTYSGLDAILRQFYNSVQQNTAICDPNLLNIEKVVTLQEKIIGSILNENENTAETKIQLPLEEEKQKNKPGKHADILVTGGTGFIGRYLVDELVSQGKRIRIVTRDLYSVDDMPDVEVIVSDIRDKEKITSALEGVDTVFHCAAAMSGDWAEHQSSTIEGTKNLLNACASAKIKTLVYVSSLGILNYNKLHNGDVVDENSPIETEPDKRGFYTKAKLLAERMVVNFQKSNPEVRVIIVRPGLVYGKESNNNLQNCGIVLGRFVLVFGLGNRYLGLNYVENLAKALVAFASSTSISLGSIIHVVDPDQPTISEYISWHNGVARKKVIPIYIPIMLWNCAFHLVDIILSLKNKKKSSYSYRFCSNSKKIFYANRVFGQDKLVRDYVHWKAAVKKSIKNDK